MFIVYILERKNFIYRGKFNLKKHIQGQSINMISNDFKLISLIFKTYSKQELIYAICGNCTKCFEHKIAIDCNKLRL